jgi:hypothetical protein
MRPSAHSNQWQIDPNAKKVIVPASVTTLPSELFRRGAAVEVLEFEGGSQLTELPGFTFRYCILLKSICIPSSVVRIQPYSLSGSFDVITFELGSNLREIEGLAFCGCSRLKSIRLPASLEVLDGCSLSDCGLTDIEIESGNKHFARRSRFVVDFEGVRIIRYFGEESAVLIPEEIESVGRYCFWDRRSIISFEFGANCHLTAIEERGFCSCSRLSSIWIPPSVTLLATRCFSCCRSLQCITFCCDSQLQTISDSAFSECRLLTSMVIPSSVEFIGEECFLGCDSLRNFSFLFPSHIRQLFDVPVAVSEIPDSVEEMRIRLDFRSKRRRPLKFGHTSNLNEIAFHQGLSSSRRHRCFQVFASRTLKMFRSRLEF